jgi:hypothetical protein
VINNCKGAKAMSQLATLKLTAAKKPAIQPLIVQQRSKLAKRLFEQMELARSQRDGTAYIQMRVKTITGIDGEPKSIEVHKRVKAWWFTADNGKLCLLVRYGSKAIELARGKSAVEVTTIDELVSALATIKAAVEAGELDAQIQAASSQLREGFKAVA